MVFNPDFSNCKYYKKIINDKVIVYLEVPKTSLKLYLDKVPNFNLEWLKHRCTLHIIVKKD